MDRAGPLPFPVAMASPTTELSQSLPASPKARAQRAGCAAAAASPESSTEATASRSTFSADARELRHALAAGGAVLEVSDGGSATPANVGVAWFGRCADGKSASQLLRGCPRTGAAGFRGSP